MEGQGTEATDLRQSFHKLLLQIISEGCHMLCRSLLLLGDQLCCSPKAHYAQHILCPCSPSCFLHAMPRLMSHAFIAGQRWKEVSAALQRLAAQLHALLILCLESLCL